MVRPMYTPHLFGVVRGARRSRRRSTDTPVFTVHRILDARRSRRDRRTRRGRRDHVGARADRRSGWVNKARDGAGRRDPPLHRQQPRLLRELAAVDADHLRAESGRRTGGRARPRHARTPRDHQARHRGRWRARRARGRVGRGGARVTTSRCSSTKEHLGGGIRWAQQLPGRDEMADFADWRIGECERRGVDIRLGVDRDRRRRCSRSSPTRWSSRPGASPPRPATRRITPCRCWAPNPIGSTTT